MMGFDSDEQLLKRLAEGSEHLEILLSDFSSVVNKLDMKLVCCQEVEGTELLPADRKHLSYLGSATCSGMSIRILFSMTFCKI